MNPVDRAVARSEDARPHLRVRNAQRHRKRTVGARPVTHHHLDAAITRRNEPPRKLSHRREGFARDVRCAAAGIGKRSKHRTATGPRSLGRWIRRVIVRADETCAFQHALGSDPQCVESKGLVERNDDDVDVGCGADATVNVVLQHVVHVDHLDPVVAHGLEHSGPRTDEGALTWFDEQRRSHRAGDDVPCCIDAEAGQLGLLFGRGRRTIVGDEDDPPAGILQARHGLGGALDCAVGAPDHPVEVTEDDTHGFRRFALPLNICHPESVPRFEPFPALRYRDAANKLPTLSAPPYDVLSADDRAHYASLDARNIVHVDVPLEEDGPGRYDKAANELAAWREEGTLVIDDRPSFTLYRMTFTDDAGRRRSTVGVLGALEVVDEGAGGVLPHERTTPKAKTDRLDLTRATLANLSPVWGLSLCSGLSELLEAPGEPVGAFTDEQGVEHRVERVADPDRVAAISKAVGSQPVVIADGHHRYAISRTYRDETRAAGASVAPAAETTLTYVAELVAEQLSIAAIHRLVTNASADAMAEILRRCYDPLDDVLVSGATLTEMDSKGCICLVRPDGTGTLWRERAADVAAVRALDSARLEHTITTSGSTLETIGVAYQHGVSEVLEALASGHAQCAVLIRPVSLAEIRRTADEGLLMPPKSTFFTPKLRTGLVIRPLAG